MKTPPHMKTYGGCLAGEIKTSLLRLHLSTADEDNQPGSCEQSIVSSFA